MLYSEVMMFSPWLWNMQTKLPCSSAMLISSICYMQGLHSLSQSRQVLLCMGSSGS